MQDLPSFRYHPSPIATGAVVASEDTCECCGKARGYKYAGPVYSEEEVETVCPWCIADGSLAAKFDASLVDDHPLRRAGVPDEVVEVVTQRTPGYESWQQEEWMACCGDACEFHGDAPAVELQALDDEALERLSEDTGFDVEVLREVIPQYVPRGSPAFYKFVCRHCGAVRYSGDCY